MSLGIFEGSAGPLFRDQQALTMLPLEINSWLFYKPNFLIFQPSRRVIRTRKAPTSPLEFTARCFEDPVFISSL